MQDKDEHEEDFGRYLASVEERDIDLLLMEEFHISDEFVSWFCAQLGLRDVKSAGAWHSVSETDGETDLLLRVIMEHHRIGVLIENKVKAPEQEKQAERYHLRGIRSREAGKFDEYLTVIAAPQRYLDALPADSAYQHRVPYEAIARWFTDLDGRRAMWRRHIMMEAIEQGRRGYVMSVSAMTTKFHHDFWDYLRLKHPRLQMRQPGNKGPSSTWIIMKGLDFPKDLKLNYKLDMQVMELGFDRRRVEDILSAQAEWPEDIAVVQKGGTASLAIAVPHVDMAAGVAAQLDTIERVLEVAYRLMPYATLLA